MREFRDRLRRRGLELDLAGLAPAPRDELVSAITARVERRARRRHAHAHVAVASLLTLAMTVALGAVGGLGYASNQASGALGVARKAVARTAPKRTSAVVAITAGGDQYRPGFGFGDPNHNHAGPPAMEPQREPGAPPLRAALGGDGFARLVSTTIVFDEQASLFASVHTADDRPLLLTQSSRRGGCRLGTKVRGPQTKFIRYTLLVPRAVPFQLRIPANLLTSGRYTIRIVGFDVEGNRTETRIPFTL